MKNEQRIPGSQVAGAAMPGRSMVPPFLRTAEVQGQHHKLRIVLPLPRRRECLTKRALIAAMRAAELAEWEASGGDCLARGPMRQRVHESER